MSRVSLRIILPALALALGLAVSGCGQDDSDIDFAFLLGAEPETIDPGTVSGQPGGRVARNIFEGLFVNDATDLSAIPGMAKTWELSEDGLTYTFHLREAVWSDGVPVTAHDFVFAWTRALDPITASKYANMLYPIRNAEEFNKGEVTDPALVGVEATDDRTLVVTMHSPCAYFIDLCCFYTLLPVPRHAIEKHGERWIRPENIVSNGPFVMTEWLLNRHVRFEKSPTYWDADNVHLNVVIGATGDNINANFNLYMSGVLDWVDASGVPLFVVPELLQRPDFHVAPYFNTYFYRFNTTKPPLDDPRVRRAFYLAMKPRDITQYVMKAGQIPAHSLVPLGLPGYQEARMPGQNIKEAQRLLAEAGYPGGKGFPKVEVLFNTSESHKQVAEVLQQQWKQALGIEVGLVNQEWKVFLATTRALEYDIARGGWIGDYLDPNTFLDLWTTRNGNNRTGFANPEYDALIDRASRTLDPQERLQLLSRAEDWIINQEQVVMPIYYYVAQNLYDERDFEGLTPNLLNIIVLKAVKPLRGHRGYPRDRHLRDYPVAQSPTSPENGSG